MIDRMISTQILPEDVKTENTLRPTLLKDYIGQEKAKNNLKVFIEAKKEPGRGSGSCIIIWASRIGKDNNGFHYSK